MAAFQTLLGLGTDRAPTPYRQISRRSEGRDALIAYVGLCGNNRISKRPLCRRGLEHRYGRLPKTAFWRIPPIRRACMCSGPDGRGCTSARATTCCVGRLSFSKVQRHASWMLTVLLSGVQHCSYDRAARLLATV